MTRPSVSRQSAAVLSVYFIKTVGGSSSLIKSSVRVCFKGKVICIVSLFTTQCEKEWHLPPPLPSRRLPPHMLNCVCRLQVLVVYKPARKRLNIGAK